VVLAGPVAGVTVVPGASTVACPSVRECPLTKRIQPDAALVPAIDPVDDYDGRIRTIRSNCLTHTESNPNAML
jgi:hypothetical protein